jgi:WS/DGAT/MGAT family acyltransferase
MATGAGTSRRRRRLSASDTVLWDLDRDPVLRSTITAIAVLDRPPDWDRLRARMERVTRRIPKLRQRVEPAVLGIGAPSWIEDDEVDLDFHLRRVRVPEPGTFRQVLDLAQPIAAAAFDQSRPLWEFTVVEGLRGGGAVLLQKMHHSITDGVGGVEIALLVLDQVAEPGEPDDPIEQPPPESADRTAFGRLIGGIGRPLAVSAKLASTVASAAASTAASAATRPLGVARSAGALLDDAYRLVAPAPSATSLMVGRGARRRFHTIDVPMRQLHDAGHLAGGTVNDAFIAAVVEGLRRYHDLHGVELAQLSVTMPVSLRRTGDDPGGNRFTPARFSLPAGPMHPIERIRTVGRIAHHWQHSPALALTDSIAGVLDLLPPAVVTFVMGSMLKGIDVVVTNVPGPPAGCYLAGAEVLGEYAMAPTSGAAVNVALVSVGATACIGISVDVAAVPDDEALIDCIAEGFGSLERLGASDAEQDGVDAAADYIQ